MRIYNKYQQTYSVFNNEILRKFPSHKTGKILKLKKFNFKLLHPYNFLQVDGTKIKHKQYITFSCSEEIVEET